MKTRQQIMLELADERSAIQITELKEEIEHLKQGQIHFENLYAQECDKVNKLEQENEKLKKQNKILLAQLVVNDDEDVTVQISQEQFDEYNQLKEDYAELLQRHYDIFERFEALIRENESLKKQSKIMKLHI